MKKFSVAIAVAALIYAASYLAMPSYAFGMFMLVSVFAIAASVNPSILSLSLLYAAVISRPSKNSVAAGGFAYSIGVFVASLVSGAVLLFALTAIGGMGAALYFALGIFIFFIAMIEVKDYFWYGHTFSLFMPKGFLRALEDKAHKSNGSLLSGLVIGAAAAFLGLSSVGASYLAALTLVAQSGASFSNSLILVGFYSIAFTIPVLFIVCITGHFTAHKRAESWKHKNREKIRLFTGMILFISSAFIISNAMAWAFSYVLEAGILIFAVMHIVSKAEVYSSLRRSK